MYCTSCGSQLPPGAQTCPTCGMPTTTSPTNEQTPQYERTVPSSPAYGSDADGSYSTVVAPQEPYGMPPPPPPYTPPQVRPSPAYTPPPVPAAPQGPGRPRRFPGGLTALLLVLIVLLLVGGGILYYANVYQLQRLRVQASATAATSTAQIRATSRAQATAAAENPYTSHATLALADPLRDNSKGYQWAEDQTNCGFTQGSYHVQAPNINYSDYCLINASAYNNYTNFVFEVQMQVIKGDGGGITFRHTNTTTTNYDYNFDVYQDGTYNLWKQNGASNPTLANGSSAAIKQGLNQVNLLAVMTRGSTITVYVNQQQIASVTDSTYSHGQIGVLVDPYYNHPTEAAFNNARIWTL